MKANSDEPKLVLVRWEDSECISNQWRWLATSKQFLGASTTGIITSVGWLYRDDKEFVTVLSTFSAKDDGGDRQYCGGMVIPRRAILSITDLAPDRQTAS